MTSASARYCILKGVALGPENDSKAHIIVSALGGRLKPRGILSQAANTELSIKFDIPLINAFVSVMILLGGSRDRGKHQEILMTDKAGIQYLVTFDAPLKITKPEYIKTETPSGHKYQIRARTMKEARILLGKAKKEYPDFDIEEALQSAAVQRTYPTGGLSMSLQIGPIVVFPSAFVMASLFTAFKTLPVHPDFKNFVENFDVNKPTLPPDTFYFCPSPPIVQPTETISHCLVFIGDAKRQQGLFYVELFNLPGIAVLMPYEGRSDVCHSYGVDVLSGEELSVEVDDVALKQYDWKPTHILGDEALFKLVEIALGRVMKIAQKRNQDNAVKQILGEVLGKSAERPITEQDIRQISRKMAEMIVSQLPHDAEGFKLGRQPRQ